MKKNNQLGYTLAAIYLLAAIIILFRWAVGFPPVGPTFYSRHGLIEILILSLPIIPAIAMGSILNQGLNDSLVFIEFASTAYHLLLVVINTISWFFIGKFLQFAFLKLFPSPMAKTDRKKARSKV